MSAVYALVHNVLNYAVYPAQLIQSNPAAYIKAPRNAPRNVVKRHIISPERFKALLEKYPFGSPLYIPLMLLYHTGMRIGEVLSLCWSDIDFMAKTININRQSRYFSSRGYFFSSPKTKGNPATAMSTFTAKKAGMLFVKRSLCRLPSLKTSR